MKTFTRILLAYSIVASVVCFKAAHQVRTLQQSSALLFGDLSSEALAAASDRQEMEKYRDLFNQSLAGVPCLRYKASSWDAARIYIFGDSVTSGHIIFHAVAGKAAQ